MDVGGVLYRVLSELPGDESPAVEVLSDESGGQHAVGDPHARRVIPVGLECDGNDAFKVSGV